MQQGYGGWTAAEQALWERLASHSFEDPTVRLDFVRRLGRAMGWSLERARQGIEEYRRFCFLAALSQSPMTPSEEVDEIWHLHLTYTRDYWEKWCGQGLRCQLHHDATDGSDVERLRCCRQYADTLAVYERYFGIPDDRFWPSVRDRFRSRARYRIADLKRELILKRPSLRTLGLACFAASAAGYTLLYWSAAHAGIPDLLAMKGEDFLGFYALLLLGTFAVVLLARSLVASNGKAADQTKLSAVEIAYIKGGYSRAGDTYFMALAAHGAAQVAGSPPQLAVLDERLDLPDDVRSFGSVPAGVYSHPAFQEAFKSLPATKRLPGELAHRQLLLGPRGRALRRALTLLLFVPVLWLGMAKIGVGARLGKPTGYLTFMVIFAVVVLVVLLFRGQQVTRGGRAALANLRKQYDRLIRAPQEAELPLAVAFVGAPALAGTAYAAYATLMQTSSGSGGSDTTSGSDGGGGGGGGGCGGCGGGN